MTLPLRAAASAGLSLRAATDADHAFLDRLYASTRAEEMAATGWPEAMQRAFLAQQHQAQHRHYQGAFPELSRLIVEQSGAAIGRLYLYPGSEALRIVDISLLPEARGRGLGAALLRDVIRHARSIGRPVALRVFHGNPARRLYARLGFVPVAGLNASHEDMIWRP
jgi:GNAT superfamily N-acetyltransferase